MFSYNNRNAMSYLWLCTKFNLLYNILVFPVLSYPMDYLHPCTVQLQYVEFLKS